MLHIYLLVISCLLFLQIYYWICVIVPHIYWWICQWDGQEMNKKWKSNSSLPWAQILLWRIARFKPLTFLLFGIKRLARLVGEIVNLVFGLGSLQKLSGSGKSPNMRLPVPYMGLLSYTFWKAWHLMTQKKKSNKCVTNSMMPRLKPKKKHVYI